MTPKEILYLDDALSHAQFLSQQCREAANQLRDPALRRQVNRLAEDHSRLYAQFYNLV